jgi:hypothetical protein
MQFHKSGKLELTRNRNVYRQYSENRQKGGRIFWERRGIENSSQVRSGQFAGSGLKPTKFPCSQFTGWRAQLPVRKHANNSNFCTRSYLLAVDDLEPVASRRRVLLLLHPLPPALHESLRRRPLLLHRHHIHRIAIRVLDNGTGRPCRRGLEQPLVERPDRIAAEGGNGEEGSSGGAPRGSGGCASMTWRWTGGGRRPRRGRRRLSWRARLGSARGWLCSCQRPSVDRRERKQRRVMTSARLRR